MDKRVAHVLGNGPGVGMWLQQQNKRGFIVTCNIPPFAVENVWTTTIVDFKMCMAMDKGEVTVPGEWVMGARPKKYSEDNPGFYIKFANQIKGFYLNLPKYCPNYTDWSCGHMAAHYVANALKCDEIHMYGFDAIFDFDLTSASDLFMNSDRGAMNNARLSGNWRSVWPNLFAEFPKVRWILHHQHDQIKIPKPDNVEIDMSLRK